MDLLAMIGGILNGIGGFLGGFLDIRFFWPTAVCLVVAAIFNPSGPTSLDKLIVSTIFGSIGAYLFVLLLKGSVTDASILALLVLTIGLIWLFTTHGGWIGRIVIAILVAVSLSALVGVSLTAPEGTILSNIVVTIRDASVAIVQRFPSS